MEDTQQIHSLRLQMVKCLYLLRGVHAKSCRAVSLVRDGQDFVHSVTAAGQQAAALMRQARFYMGAHLIPIIAAHSQSSHDSSCHAWAAAPIAGSVSRQSAQEHGRDP